MVFIDLRKAFSTDGMFVSTEEKHDVAANSVIPVELRSPRSGTLREGGSRGASNREKRNAMVFVFPSSDDSETENVLAKSRKDQ